MAQHASELESKEEAIGNLMQERDAWEQAAAAKEQMAAGQEKAAAVAEKEDGQQGMIQWPTVDKLHEEQWFTGAGCCNLPENLAYSERCAQWLERTEVEPRS